MHSGQIDPMLEPVAALLVAIGTLLATGICVYFVLAYYGIWF